MHAQSSSQNFAAQRDEPDSVVVVPGPIVASAHVAHDMALVVATREAGR